MASRAITYMVKDKPCRLCGTVFSPRSRPQIHCEPCNGRCRVDGCTHQVRARGLCAAHGRQQPTAVPAIVAASGGGCGVEGCERHEYSKGYCQLHYDRVRLTGSVGAATARARKSRGQPCSVEGCEKPARGDGLCITHYARRQKHGEIGPAELLRAAQGEGHVKPNGYRVVVVGGSYVFEHRFVMEEMLGRKLRHGEQVHHRDGDKLNNAPANLELWSRYQPSGQRVQDKVNAAIRLLQEYPDQHSIDVSNINPSEVLGGMMACW